MHTGTHIHIHTCMNALTHMNAHTPAYAGSRAFTHMHIKYII